MRQTVERRRLKGRNASRAIHSLAKHSNIAQFAKHEHKAEQLPGVEGCDHALLFSAIQCLSAMLPTQKTIGSEQAGSETSSLPLWQNKKRVGRCWTFKIIKACCTWTVPGHTLRVARGCRTSPSSSAQAFSQFSDLRNPQPRAPLRNAEVYYHPS